MYLQPAEESVSWYHGSLELGAPETHLTSQQYAAKELKEDPNENPETLSLLIINRTELRVLIKGKLSLKSYSFQTETIHKSISLEKRMKKNPVATRATKIITINIFLYLLQLQK